MTLAIGVDDAQVPPVLRLRGEIDLNTAPHLSHAADRLIDDGHLVLVLDLSAVDFCDSSGLSALIRVRNRLLPADGQLILAGPTPMVRRLLETSGLTEIFGTYPSVEEARAAIG